MQELINMAFSGVNLFYTILLLFALVYCLSVILGALSMDTFDIDVDVDADVEVDIDIDADIDMDADVDVDADTEMDMEAGSSAGWFIHTLHFFNFGRIPFMIILTISSMTMWLISIYLQKEFGPSWPMAFALFIPNLFAGLIVTKILTNPLVPIFEQLDKGEKPVDYVGMECELLFDLKTGEKGQAEVTLENHTSLLITIKLADGQPTLKKSHKAIVVSENKTEGLYYVRDPGGE